MRLADAVYLVKGMQLPVRESNAIGFFQKSKTPIKFSSPPTTPFLQSGLKARGGFIIIITKDMAFAYPCNAGKLDPLDEKHILRNQALHLKAPLDRIMIGQREYPNASLPAARVRRPFRPRRCCECAYPSSMIPYTIYSFQGRMTAKPPMRIFTFSPTHMRERISDGRPMSSPCMKRLTLSGSKSPRR